METQNASTIKTYLSIFEGRFVQKVKEGTPEARERINAKGTKVFEIVKKSASGYINKMYIKSTDFGNFIVLNLASASGIGQIEIPVNSQYASDFALRVQNVDFKAPVNLKPMQIENEDKESGKTYTNEMIGIYQIGANNLEEILKPSEDQKKALPYPAKKKEGKKDKWDFTDRNNFVLNLIEEIANTKIKPIYNEINLLAGLKDA